MGSGKGAPEYWVAVVKPGRIMFEIEGVTEAQARDCLLYTSIEEIAADAMEKAALYLADVSVKAVE